MRTGLWTLCGLESARHPMDAFDWRQRLRDNVARVRADIAQACARVGRDPAEVRLVAVTKYVAAGVLPELLTAGLVDLGENRVQQLVARARELGAARFDWPETPAEAAGAGPRWHMIGHLQRNKVKLLLPHARIIHSLDSLRLVEALVQQADRLNTPLDLFIEVNLAGETSKTGAAPELVAPIAAAVAGHKLLQLRGLMTMAPFDPRPEAARPYFRRLRQMLVELCANGVVGPECRHLSMGMTQDYTVAVEEGATFVRLGSALFEGLPEAVLRPD